MQIHHNDKSVIVEKNVEILKYLENFRHFLKESTIVSTLNLYFFEYTLIILLVILISSLISFLFTPLVMV